MMLKQYVQLKTMVEKMVNNEKGSVSMEWIMLGQPQHKTQLLEAIHHRYRYAPAPEKGQIASLWSRMRDYTAHLQKD